MSFGFGIGDFIAVGELCWKLYSQVYKVSRDAPEELRGLNQELGNFHNSIQLLLEELKDEHSVLVRSGDVRTNTVRRVMSHSKETLEKMQQFSVRYAELQTPSTERGKRRSTRIFWDKLKYSREIHTINDLRSKIMLHNSQLTLVLQGAQNSSLERIEKQNAQTDKKLDELRQLLDPDRASRDRLMLTAPLETNALEELTDAFLQKAEFDNRPWASIGIDSWLQIGQWWLMKAESQLGVASEAHEHNASYNQGYINLLKACWILTNVIAIHPQRAHMGASNDRRAHHIQRLTQGATSKLNTFSKVTFQLEDLLICNLDIWNLLPSTALTPRRRNTGDQPELKWQTRNGEILFQKFAEYQDDEREPPVECMVIIVMPSEQCVNALSLDLIVQNSLGQDIYKRRSTSHARNDSSDTKNLPIRFFSQQDKRFLDCMLNSLLLFQYSPNPLPTDASMIYSAALLHTCVAAGKPLLDGTFQSSTTNEDIDTLVRSRQEFQIQPTTHTSSIFQQIVDRIVKYIKQCSEGFPTRSDRMFWTQAHHCDWMLIYWLCDTFEAFSELFEAIGFRAPYSHPVSKNCLVASSLLRKDAMFPEKFIPFMGLWPNWLLNNNDIILIAILNDDTPLLESVIKKSEAMSRIKGWRNWSPAWDLAYTHLKWDAMNVLLSVPPEGFFLHEPLFWLVIHHKWYALHIFSNFIRPHSNYFKMSNFQWTSDLAQIALFYSCAELIYKGSLHDMEVFFDIIRRMSILDNIRRLGFFLDTSRLVFSTKCRQSVVLSALASRKLSILKLLCEAGVVSLSLETINCDDYMSFRSQQSRLGNLATSSRLSLTRPPLLLDLAIAFVSDFETVEYLCQTGARLQKGPNNTDIEEPETLRQLRLTTSVADARKQNLFMKGICYQLYSEECSQAPFALYLDLTKSDGKTSYASSTGIWKTTGRILFEGDCRHLYNIADVSPGSTWLSIQNELYSADLKDTPVKKAASWPEPLSTQENWEAWRLKVIDILEEINKDL